MKKNTLYIFTLEPIEQRYTKQWYSYWKQEFSKKYNVIYIDGSKQSDKIVNGKFLDINKTNIWKSEQITKVSKLFAEGKIKNTDKFLFMDAWHYGITAVKYMIQLNNMNCKMYGYWHAGTYDPYDFITQAGLKEWAEFDEYAWLKALDGSFVATKFHKNLICRDIPKLESKVHIVGFPMDWEKVISKEVNLKDIKKENIVVFPHRLDKEKQPEKFDEMSKLLPIYKFIKTLEVTKTKKQYYEILKKSKVSFSANLQETFGIGTVEALMLGNIPIVPNTLAYSELYDDMFKYESEYDAIIRTFVLLENYNMKIVQDTIKENKKRIIKQSLGAIPKMIKIMEENGNEK